MRVMYAGFSQNQEGSAKLRIACLHRPPVHSRCATNACWVGAGNGDFSDESVPQIFTKLSGSDAAGSFGLTAFEQALGGVAAVPLIG